MTTPEIVDTNTWLEQRQLLLEKEKEFTRLRDELTLQRQAMPWVLIDKSYRFTTNEGEQSLLDLFGSKSQLLIYHFMYGKNWQEGCSSCSYWADNFNGIDVHLANRDISFVVVSSAELSKLQAFRKRMGWSFNWVSASDTDFNQDLFVSFTDAQREKGEKYYNYKKQPWFVDEMVGASVFVRDQQERVFHSYSTYARGVDILNGAYNYIDLTPKGRNEGDTGQSWVRHHDKYETP